MKTVQALLFSALSTSVLGSADVASAQPTSDWSCAVGQCDLTLAPVLETTSQDVCVNEQRNFFVENISNASVGPNSGSFRFAGQLTGAKSAEQTLDTFHTSSLARGYIKDVILTVHAPSSVENVSVNLASAGGHAVGKGLNDNAGGTVVYWSPDYGDTPETGAELRFEIQGNAVSEGSGLGYHEPAKLWVNVSGTRCSTL